MAETHECPNCGATISSDEKACKYCGSQNPFYTKTIFPFTSSSDQKTASNQEKSSDVNWGIFILLLIVFWPAAIIYLVVTQNKK